MRGNRRRDTKPELAIRRALHGLGYRYRVDVRPLPELNRRADIVFTRLRIAIYVHGCYWHGCPKHFRTPTRNAEFWQAKIDRNRERDEETTAVLSAAGWDVVTVWTHEPVAEAVDRIEDAIRRRRNAM